MSDKSRLGKIAQATAIGAKEGVEENQVTYVVHGAEIQCSCGLRKSNIVVPKSHGTFIHDIPQLRVGDSKPNENILSFGGCTSPENPFVQEAAKNIVREVKNREKSFMDKVMDFFCKKPEEEVNKDFIGTCAGVCKPAIDMSWIDGKKDTFIVDNFEDEKEDYKALLSTCTLTCIYGGKIIITDDGQQKKEEEVMSPTASDDLSATKGDKPDLPKGHGLNSDHRRKNTGVKAEDIRSRKKTKEQMLTKAKRIKKDTKDKASIGKPDLPKGHGLNSDHRRENTGVKAEDIRSRKETKEQMLTKGEKNKKDIKDKASTGKRVIQNANNKKTYLSSYVESDIAKEAVKTVEWKINKVLYEDIGLEPLNTYSYDYLYKDSYVASKMKKDSYDELPNAAQVIQSLGNAQSETQQMRTGDPRIDTVNYVSNFIIDYNTPSPDAIGNIEYILPDFSDEVKQKQTVSNEIRNSPYKYFLYTKSARERFIKKLDKIEEEILYMEIEKKSKKIMLEYVKNIKEMNVNYDKSLKDMLNYVEYVKKYK
ncbi:DUF4280 domain-containing protein [Anaerophilus nitritogenes]|uniref:DUF4280 domain-containing protein n=1 Tax=Anaerophilus nitritogenes TaxID=2498136 RepID=UPI0013E9E610|nr:DUF4280 domain-containing protein [Anaerophilus nitritogenes]